MARPRSIHRCTECGATASRWVGRCSVCEAWGTLVEEAAPSGGQAPPPTVLRSAPVALADVDPDANPARPTGVPELDRVLGGGLVPGSVTLVGGEPGIGKSTLLLQAAARLAGAGATCLLISGEESVGQVRARAARLGPVPPRLLVHAETALPQVLGAIEASAPELCVVDSIQTMYDPEVASSPGSVLQVRECAQALARAAKERGMSCVLVGHVTKDGALAGPRVLEHLVDTVLAFEGDRHHALRLLRAAKHRFGPTGELGLFEMGDGGLSAVAEPASLLLGDRRPGVPGSVVVPALDGRRPLLVEVQALVARSELATPRRSAQGIDAGRLSQVLAVLDRRAAVSVAGFDVYASVVGGVRVAEPGADLAVAMALASATLGLPVPADVIALGEVGLGGEIRQVHQTPLRLSEAARLGFRRALVPVSTLEAPPGLALSPVTMLDEAVALLHGLPPAPVGDLRRVG